jgi:hypothetical protein
VLFPVIDGWTLIFSQGHGLDDRKTLRGAIAQVMLRFLAVQAMKQFPGRIAQVKKRRAVVVFQVTVVGCYPQLPQTIIEFGC